MTEIYGLQVSDHMKRKTALPQNFAVTDAHRAYCTEKWNRPHLADVFIEEFRACFEANGRKHLDWDRTFLNYLRNASPAGQFYKAHHWQTKVESARRMEAPERRREPIPYHPREFAARTDPVTAHVRVSELLAKLRA